jgi:nesprin-1
MTTSSLEVSMATCCVCRKRKLQETVLAVKQLESSMHNLSRWLATVEQELTAPVLYHDCDMQEIHSKLNHTQVTKNNINKWVHFL